MNLVSVSQSLDASDMFLTFYAKNFLLQGINLLKKIGKGNLDNGLYTFHSYAVPGNSDAFVQNKPQVGNSVASDCNVVPVSNPHDNATIWHSRLGHLSDSVLKLVSSQLHVSIPSSFNTHQCNICPLAKFKRLFFQSGNNMCNEPLDFIHCDVWRP